MKNLLAIVFSALLLACTTANAEQTDTAVDMWYTSADGQGLFDPMPKELEENSVSDESSANIGLELTPALEEAYLLGWEELEPVLPPSHSIPVENDSSLSYDEMTLLPAETSAIHSTAVAAGINSLDEIFPLPAEASTYIPTTANTPGDTATPLTP